MADIIAIVVFVLIFLVVFRLAEQIRRSFRDPVRRRLATLQAAGASTGTQPIVESLAAQLPQRGTAKNELAAELRRAGYLRPAAINVFLALRNGSVIAALIITGLVAIWLGPTRQDLVLRVIVAGVAVAGLCFGLPRLIVRSQGRQRVERISRGLPFALDMTVMCLSGGLTLRDALAHVTAEVGLTHPDLATELAIIQRQADMSSMESAFRQFALRIDSPEVAAMAALIIQNEQLGTNIADSIRNYAEGIRLKWRQNADERAGRVVIYMLFPLAFFLLPAIFLMLGGPAVLKMVNFFQETLPALSNDLTVGPLDQP